MRLCRGYGPGLFLLRHLTPRTEPRQVAADTTKRTECVKVCFSEQMFLDLNRRAIREDRTLSELVYLIVRDDEYGKGKGPGVNPEGTASD